LETLLALEALGPGGALTPLGSLSVQSLQLVRVYVETTHCLYTIDHHRQANGRAPSRPNVCKGIDLFTSTCDSAVAPHTCHHHHWL